MGCRKLFGNVTLLAVAMLFIGSSVSAFESTVYFNEVTQELEYSVIDGEADANYIIHVNPVGCVTVDGTPPTIIGPSGSASVGLLCVSASGSSAVEVQVCKDDQCFDIYNLNFNCSDECVVRQLRSGVPSLTNWSIAGLVILLMVLGVFAMRRKVRAER